ncbi:putative Trypsin [Crenothrix polyspora]|uniref:Putative Trypsin n=1 Tax=Crenothrix polyspora TaxID=360316 RepID=A0A1R4H866_9GAMM|nr:trypsin-like serine protease [Crenothrix polyspora]SJM92376.1 putative Trypsin [Crenothrix polyspora]
MSVKKYPLCFILLLCTLSAITLSAATSANAAITPKPRIVGGQPSVFGQWPWMIALVKNKGLDNSQGLFCGGSLISLTWVLTAAHCVKKETPGTIHALAHVLDLKNDKGQNLAIKRILIHPKYNIDTRSNDIALVQLQKPVSSAKILPLYTGASLLVNVNATIVGWGALSENDANFGRYPETLYDVTLPVISNSLCKKAYEAGAITDTMLCAGFNDASSDTCSGDSGGPLVIKLNNQWRLAGITSWGIGCAKPGYYGVYTRVSKYIGYISTVMKTNFVAIADVNKDKKVNTLDKNKKDSDLKAVFQTWVKQCWQAKLPCADVNANGIINQSDYQIQNKLISDAFKYWLAVYWQPEVK